MDYNRLINQCHSAAKKNGWWDEPRPHEGIILLIKSELFEAMDAYRSDRRANKADFESIADLGIGISFKEAFKLFIKDTFEDEIADTAIRIFDYLGFLGAEFKNYVSIPDFGIYEEDFMEVLQKLDVELSRMYDEQNLKYRLFDMLDNLSIIAKSYDFDLHTHIQLKLRYNATRGKKHGKRF